LERPDPDVQVNPGRAAGSGSLGRKRPGLEPKIFVDRSLFSELHHLIGNFEIGREEACFLCFKPQAWSNRSAPQWAIVGAYVVHGFARRGVVVADLARSDFGILGIYLLTGFLVRHPMNKFDGRLSIRRAFSFRELAAAAAEAGWSGFGHRRFPVNRQAIWLEGEALTLGGC
jgi:hypothetical protein